MDTVKVVAFRFTTVQDAVEVELFEAGSPEEKEFREGLIHPGSVILAEVSVDVDADVWRIHQSLASFDEDYRIEKFDHTLIEIGIKLVQQTG